MYIKSAGPVLAGHEDKLEIFVAKQTQFENPELLDSDDVY